MSFFSELLSLTEHHKAACSPYRFFCDSLFSNKPRILEQLPFIPVRAFKSFDLKSVPSGDVVRVMSSSGTTGENPSKIYLDKRTALLQSKELVNDFSEFIGESRIPFLIVSDQVSSVTYTAQDAAVNGFSIFAKDKLHAHTRGTNHDEVVGFLEANSNETLLIFGFTFQIWLWLQQLVEQKMHLNLSNSIVLHGGGWKKLESQAVSKTEFQTSIREIIGAKRVHNYYGMIEQTGSVYFECESGFLHSPRSGLALARDPISLEPLPEGEKGVLQVFSTIQWSYPGHSVLTEDVGKILPPGECACGRTTQRIEVSGRLNRAEVRGCSDAVR